MMFIELYLLFAAFTLIIFFLSIANVFKLPKESRLLMMVISTILLIVMIFSSFYIEYQYCELPTNSTTFSCTVEPHTEILPALMFIMMLIISILYIFFEALGWLPQI